MLYTANQSQCCNNLGFLRNFYYKDHTPRIGVKTATILPRSIAILSPKGSMLFFHQKPFKTAIFVALIQEKKN